MVRSSSGFAVLTFALHKLPELASVGTDFPINFFVRAVDSQIIGVLAVSATK